MNKLHLLGANRSYDRDEQTVSVNQVVVLEGYSYDSYVVYEVNRSQWGITYHLINLRTYEFHTSDLIRPLSEKFGIGIYYDDANPKFLDPLETAVLLTKATEKKTEDDRKAEEERQRNERTAKIGAERLRPLIPSDAKAVIIGELRVSECDSYTDYYDYRIERTVILGFSTHTRNLFSEMRKYAANFEGTAYLTENNKEYWRLLACPITFRDDKAVCSGLFLRCFFHTRICRLFLHFRLILVSRFCSHSRDVPLSGFPHRRTRFLFHFPFRAFTPFLLFLFHRIEPSGNAPQRFCHAAACLPETYLAELSPEQKLVHEQIGEQQPEQNDPGFIVT